MSPDQRKLATEVAVDHAGGRIPVIVHCGAADTATSAELAGHAATLGAWAAAAVAPYFFGYGPTDLDHHFTAVAEAAPELALYLYENPERAGYSIGVEVVTGLVERVPNILGVKDTGDSIGRITQYLAGPGRRPEVYTGNNVTILPALVVGARGAVSALANGVPELLVALYDAWTKDDVDACRELQFAVTRLHGCLAGLPYVGAVKHLVELRGLPAGETRAPQALLGPEQAAVLEARLHACGELRPWLEAIAG
jgi:dihydrodipicolinate synthase/N-acetylneuraminate lyase